MSFGSPPVTARRGRGWSGCSVVGGVLYRLVAMSRSRPPERLPPIDQAVVEPALAERVVASLRGPGFVVLDDVLPQVVVDTLASEARSEAAALEPAGVGRGDEYRRLERVRRDHIRWIAADTPARAWYFAWSESLRVELNRHLFLGLFDYEAHVARYLDGAFYRRHVDAFRGGSNRRVSTVLYLNTVSEGGELVIYPAERPTDMVVPMTSQQAPIDVVVPRCGRVVLFLSEEIPHEVMAVREERWSIAGWFRVNSGPPLVPATPTRH